MCGAGNLSRISHVALCLTLCLSAGAESWIASCDGPETSWKADTRQGVQRILRHERVRLSEPGSDAPSRGSEQITYACPPGHSCWFWTSIPPAAVIEELNLRLEMRADSPGSQLAAEVTLPRITHPETGQALRLVVKPVQRETSPAGDLTLHLRDIRSAIRRRLRAEIIRDRQGTPIQSTDIGEAYVSRVALVAPGHTNPRNVWIHELRVDGLVTPSRLLGQEKVDGIASTEPRSPQGRAEPSRVTLTSDGFRIDDRLFFPRAWAWRGEDLEELAKRGFNTLMLDEPPSDEMLRQAKEHRMRLLCPPPLEEIPMEGWERWEPVLAWRLPGVVSRRQSDSRLAQAERIRSFPIEVRRPLLVKTSDAAARWSRLADGLLIDTQESLHTPAEDAGRLIQQTLGESKAGVVWLAEVSLGVSGSAQRQIDAMLGAPVVATWLPPGDSADATHEAIARGCRGVIYQAPDPIVGADEATRLAERWIGVLNNHLRLIEPWLVGPQTVTRLPDSHIVLLERHGVRLALPPLLQSTTARATVLPGIGSSAYVFRLTPTGLRVARSNRVAGGLSIEPHGSNGAATSVPNGYLLCNDPRVPHSISRYLTDQSATNAELWKLTAQEAHRRTEALDRNTQSRVQMMLSNASLYSAQRSFSSVYDEANAALSTIDSAERGRRAIATRSDTMTQSSPLAVLPITLTDHFRVMHLLTSAQRGPNRLHGGSFEDLDQVRSHGWRRLGGESESIQIDLADGSSIDGQKRLRIRSESHGKNDAVPRVVSPEIEVAPGELLEIVGWARLKSLPGGIPGRLRVQDSLGGRELSITLEPDEEWKPFRLLRRSMDTTTLSLSLSVEGTAEAEVDGVMIRPVIFQKSPSIATRPGATTPRTQPK